MAALVVVVALAFWLSPWPSVAVITYMFSGADQASEQALEKHVPAGIEARYDLPYGPHRDEVFDLFHLDAASEPQATIVWVHGGGFIAGSKSGISNYMKVLAGRGYTTVALEYSKGYGTTYPRPVEQVNAALAYLISHATELKIDPTRLVLAGDSAGGHIASQAVLIATSPAYAQAIGIQPAITPDRLAATMLLSGAYDPTAVNFEGSYGWFLRTTLWAYVGVKNFQDSRQFQLMSVTGHVTRDFPASFISSGNGDPLAPQARALAERLTSLGVRVDALFFPPGRTPPLPHEYQFDLDDAGGQEALARMLAFLEPLRERRNGSRISSAEDGGLLPVAGS